MANASNSTTNGSRGRAEAENVVTHPSLYWAYLGTWHLVLGILAFLFPNVGIMLLVANALLLAVMAKAVGAGYVGGVLVFGVATITPWPFPVVLLPGMRLARMREYPPQWQFPGEPENVFHGHDSEPLPEKMVRPLRILTGKPTTEYEAINPVLNIQMSTKVAGTVRSRIRDFWMVWFRNAGDDEDGKLREMFRQTNDTWLRVVKAEWAKRPVGQVIDDINNIETVVRDSLDEDVFLRGFDVYEVTLLPPDLDHDMSSELSGIGEAKAQRIQGETDALRDKFIRERDAEAAAYELKTREEAESDAIKDRADKLKMEPRELIALEEAPKILGDKDKLIFGADGLTQAMNVGTAIMDTFRDKKKDGDERGGNG